MRYLILILLFWTSFFSLELYAQDYKKMWSDSSLTWSDFNDSMVQAGVTELVYVLQYQSGKQKFNDTTIVRLIASCYMDKQSSWVHPDYKKDQYLAYNQVIFNLAELYRRKLQFALDRVSAGGAEETFQYIFRECSNEVNRFQIESNSGRIESSVREWSDKVKIRLEQNKVRNIPEFETKALNVGYFLGAGLSTFYGPMSDYIRTPINFNYTLDLGYHNHKLMLEAVLGSSKVKKPFHSNEVWPLNNSLLFTQVNASYGYVLNPLDKVRWTPFIGYGYDELSTSIDMTGNIAGSELRLGSNAIYFGINCDYVFHSFINILPNPLLTPFVMSDEIPEKYDLKTHGDISLRTRLTISKPYFKDDIHGYVINLTVGIGGINHFIRIRK